MAQGMRRNIRRNACGFRIGFQNFPESLTTHRTSGAVDKQYIILPSMHQGCARTPQILLQRLFRRSAERNDPLLFIAAGDVAHHKVDILYLQMDQLTDADTGRIQHFQHCFVADPLWRVGFGLAKQQIDLCDGKDLRHFPLNPRWLQCFRRVRYHFSLLTCILAKHMNRRNAARDRCRGEVFPLQI